MAKRHTFVFHLHSSQSTQAIFVSFIAFDFIDTTECINLLRSRCCDTIIVNSKSTRGDEHVGFVVYHGYFRNSES
jgi:hypothetical protein